MASILHIEIGSVIAPGRQVDIEGLQDGVQHVLHLIGLSVDFTIAIIDGFEGVKINQVPCIYPDNLQLSIADWLADKKNTIPEENKNRLFWYYWIRSVMMHQASMLLTKDAVYELMPALRNVDAERKDMVYLWCKHILQELLSFHLSLGAKDSIREIAAEYLQDAHINLHAFREKLFYTALQRSVSIFIEPVYFADLLNDADDQHLFSLLRDGLFQENGVRYPAFEIMIDETLPYGSFYFSQNAFTSIPAFGLLHGKEVLINDTPERLQANGIEGRSAINPANGLHHTIAPAEQEAAANQMQYATWTGLGYVVLALSRFLRKSSGTWMDALQVTQYLQDLKTYPGVVVDRITKSKSTDITTQSLRFLAKDGISIKALPDVLEAVLSFDSIVADGTQHIIFDERLPVIKTLPKDDIHFTKMLVEYVRIQLRQTISQQYKTDATTMNVFLIDPSIEQWIDSLPDGIIYPGDEMIKKIYAAVVNEFTRFPQLWRPVILTTVSTRSTLQQILSFRYQDIVVLSYQELSPELRVQPLGRITLL